MTHFLQSRGLQKLLQSHGSRYSIGQFLSLLHERSFISFSRARRDLLEENLTYGPSKRTDVKLLNEQLVTSVHQQNFPGAERLRLHLQSEFAFIEPHPVYERAALAQIRSPATADLQAFLTWLHLVPDNTDPSRVENGAMTKTRNTLFRTGTPARNLRLIREFSLVCAAKGYAKLVWDDLVRLLSRFEYADKAVMFFLEFESALLEYYKKHHPGEVEAARGRQRYLLVLLCVEAGWLEEAVRVVQDSEGERIGRACERLAEVLRARGDEANVALVEACMQKARRDDGPTALSDDPPPPKPSIAQRLGGLFKPVQSASPPTHSYYSIRAVIERTIPPRPRPWIALKLRELKHAIRNRSLYLHKGSGKTLHQLMAHYIASSPGEYPRALLTLRKRALAASDTTAYTFITKELYYLHEARLYADIAAVFDANFKSAFLPKQEWGMLRAASKVEARGKDAVPAKMTISSADAWVVWNALIRLSVSMPLPLSNSDGSTSDTTLATLSSLHHSAVHFASTLTKRQFLAFPTSYTTVFRSIVYAYSCVSPPQMDKAVAAARDLALIGQLHPATVGLWDELAAAYARAGDIRAVERLLGELEGVGPRLATYGVVIDAYLENGMVEEAVQVEARMKRKCEYVPGRNWRMDATLNALRWRRRWVPTPDEASR